MHKSPIDKFKSLLRFIEAIKRTQLFTFVFLFVLIIFPYVQFTYPTLGRITGWTLPGLFTLTFYIIFCVITQDALICTHICNILCCCFFLFFFLIIVTYILLYASSLTPRERCLVTVMIYPRIILHNFIISLIELDKRL